MYSVLSLPKSFIKRKNKIGPTTELNKEIFKKLTKAKGLKLKLATAQSMPTSQQPQYNYLALSYFWIVSLMLNLLVGTSLFEMDRKV